VPVASDDRLSGRVFPETLEEPDRLNRTFAKTKTMKTIKTLIIAACAVACLTTAALAEEKKMTCCEKAIAAGKECKNKCCVSAHRDGKSCEKCNPNKEDLKAMKKGEKKTEK
jgi:hypothetical protein